MSFGLLSGCINLICINGSDLLTLMPSELLVLPSKLYCSLYPSLEPLNLCLCLMDKPISIRECCLINGVDDCDSCKNTIYLFIYIPWKMWICPMIFTFVSWDSVATTKQDGFRHPQFAYLFRSDLRLISLNKF